MWFYNSRSLQNTKAWFPRPRRVCQESVAQVYLIHRARPWVPLPNILRILICFISYIFKFSIFGGLGCAICISGQPQCPVTLSIFMRMRLLIRQWDLRACLAWAKVRQDEDTLWQLCHKTGKNWQIKWMQFTSMEIFQYINEVSEEFFHTCKWFYCIAAQNLDWCQQRWIKSSQVVWKLIGPSIWQMSHSC